MNRSLNTIWIVDIEAVETRYTKEWREHLPEYIKSYAFKNNYNVNVIQISGTDDIPQTTTPGAFLNFAGTNVYKSSQAIHISNLFANNEIKPGDQFLFTDAWNPVIIQVKYMSSLLNIPVTIHGLWHAGSYDPNDFLGRIKDGAWARQFERALAVAIDYNYFATEYHKQLFYKGVMNKLEINQKRKLVQVRTGWPMTYVLNYIDHYKGVHKRNRIVFPHRIAPEKQLPIFKELARAMPEYEWIVCQEKTLTKDQYHAVLASSKIVFSANLQETLGISCYEGAAHGAIPMVPNRLSYEEMYMDDFKYPSEWTTDMFNAIGNLDKISAYIRDRIENYEKYLPALKQQVDSLTNLFFSSESMLDTIFNDLKSYNQQ